VVGRRRKRKNDGSEEGSVSDTFANCFDQ